MEKTIFISEIEPVTYNNKVREKSLIKSITEKKILNFEREYLQHFPFSLRLHCYERLSIN